MVTIQSSPAAGDRAGRARGKRLSSASGGALLAACEGVAHQRQSVVAEIHIGLVDEDGRRAETTARHYFIRVGLELVLNRLLADAGKELLRIDADALADVREHGVLRNVLILAPVDFEHGARERRHILAE